MSNCGPPVDPRDPEKPKKPKKPEVWVQGGAGWTFLASGGPRGRAPKAPERTGRVGLGCGQAYWIP